MELPNRLTVAENLRIYAELYEVAEPKKRIAELAETLDLVPLLTRPAGRLSAGQKTRVGLAKSLLNDPEFLALDEPTASLDPDTADRIRGYLESYRSDSGGSILLASHNMAEVERLCDEVLMMRSGTIVDRGAPADLIARYGRKNLEEVFLDIARTPGGANALPAQAAQ
ncbi:MAG: ABC transporter ATP-binding protein, partial [Alphaproteobacteria bacterium]